MAPAAAPAAPNASGRSFELMVGGRWAGWAGALVVVVAVGFFLKYAYDQGWLGGVTPLVRCLAAAGFGAALLAAGELALRRVNRGAAVGLFVAGLGTLYLTALAAHRLFNLVGDAGGLVLLSATAVVGVLVTLRGRLAMIGVLSLLAGYASPLLLEDRAASLTALPAYLTALLAVGLVLSALMPGRHRALRTATLVMHGIAGAVWMASADKPGVEVAFAACWWAMVMAETTLAALREQSRRGNAIAILAATAWVATMVVIALKGAGADPVWAAAVLAALALAGVATVITLGDGLEALRRWPSSAFDLFSVAVWLQSGVLLVTAAAVQLSGGALTAAWLAIAVGAVELGRWLQRAAHSAPAVPVSEVDAPPAPPAFPSTSRPEQPAEPLRRRAAWRGAEIFGLVVAAAAVGKLFTIDAFEGGLRGAALELPSLGVAASWWSLLAGAAAVAVAVLAWRLRAERGPFRGLAVAAMAVATLILLLAIAAAAPGTPGTIGWLAVAAALLATERAGCRLRHFEIGVAAFVATVGRWLAIDCWSVADAQVVAPWLNAHLALVAPLALVAAWIFRLLRRRQAELLVSNVLPGRFATLVIGLGPGAIIALVLLGVSVEAARALEARGGVFEGYSALGSHALSWIAIWSLGAIAMAALGAFRDQAPTRVAGEAVALAAVFFWLVVGTTLEWVDQGLAPTAPLINLQAVAGLLAGGACAVAMALPKRADVLRIHHDRQVLGAAVVAVVVWLGSFELARALREPNPFAAPSSSVWWALCGIALIGTGFWRRQAWLRHLGLGLLGVTVVKFILVDLYGADTLVRIVASAVVGLLLVGTSVLYMRVGAKVTGGAARERGRERAERR